MTVGGGESAHSMPGLETALEEFAKAHIFFDDSRSKLEPVALVASYLTVLGYGASDAEFRFQRWQLLAISWGKLWS